MPELLRSIDVLDVVRTFVFRVIIADQKNYCRGEKEDVGSLQTVLPSSYDLLDTTLGESWIGRIMFGVRFIAKQKSVGCMPIHVKWSWTNLWFMKKVGEKIELLHCHIKRRSARRHFKV